MKIKEWLKIAILLVTIIALFTGTSHAFEKALDIEATENYKKWEALPEEEKKNYIQPLPTSIKLNKISQQNLINSNLKSTTIPESYFLGDDIELIVRNQQHTNSCWAFATTNLISTNLQKIGRENSFVSLSTRHMDYTTSQTFSNGKNLKGYKRNVYNGGNTYLGLSYCTAGYGPIVETDMPFENNENSITLSQIENKDLKTTVKEYKIFPSIYKKLVNNNVVYYNGYGESSTYYDEYTEEEINAFRQEVKQHIINYGALTTYTYMNGTDFFEAAGDTVYYCYDEFDNIMTNHAVTIVGWDDTYAKENFAITAKHDGAYKVLNSWGDSWGDNGYYYISYDDVFVENSLIGVVDTYDVDYDNLYQYDPFGNNTNLTYYGSDELYAANVFTSNKKENSDEYLNEISISTTEEIDVEIYVNLNNDSKDIKDMTKVATVYSLEPGYKTIRLDSSMKITGEKFVVAMKTPQASVPVELNYSSNGDGSNFWDNATSEAEQSYLSFDGVEWYDFTDTTTVNCLDTNVCMKAFTTYETINIENLCGDLNADNVVDRTDLTYLGKYLNGTQGYTVTEEKADVNGDGEVDWLDYSTLKKHIAGETGYETLPKVYACGDVNRDYTVNASDIGYLGKCLNGTYTAVLKVSDVNEDGQVDWKDYSILKKHIAGETGYEFLPILYPCGDINRDYTLDGADITYLGRYLNGNTNYPVIIKIADVNEDGEVDWKDYNILKKHIAEETGYEDLPKPYPCGDINRDYAVNATDITYLGRNLNGNTNYPVITKIADVNEDGQVDWKDYSILKKHIAGETGYEELPKPYSLGDINRDYEVNRTDLTYLGRYLNGVNGYPIIKLLADINFDGQVDWADYKELKSYIDFMEI